MPCRKAGKYVAVLTTYKDVSMIVNTIPSWKLFGQHIGRKCQLARFYMLMFPMS